MGLKEVLEGVKTKTGLTVTDLRSFSSVKNLGLSSRGDKVCPVWKNV